MTEIRRLPDFHPCDSTLVAQYGYDPETLHMFAELKDGKRYRFMGVTQERFQGFIESGSKGRYLVNEIWKKHEYERLL